MKKTSLVVAISLSLFASHFTKVAAQECSSVYPTPAGAFPIVCGFDGDMELLNTRVCFQKTCGTTNTNTCANQKGHYSTPHCCVWKLNSDITSGGTVYGTGTCSCTPGACGEDGETEEFFYCTGVDWSCNTDKSGDCSGKGFFRSQAECEEANGSQYGVTGKCFPVSSGSCSGLAYGKRGTQCGPRKCGELPKTGGGGGWTPEFDLGDVDIDDFLDILKQNTGTNGVCGKIDNLGALFNCALTYIIFPAAGFALFLMILWGAYKMVNGSMMGSQSGVEAGRRRIIGAILGFLLLAIAYWLWRIVEIVTGVKITG